MGGLFLFAFGRDRVCPRTSRHRGALLATSRPTGGFPFRLGVPRIASGVSACVATSAAALLHGTRAARIRRAVARSDAESGPRPAGARPTSAAPAPMRSPRNRKQRQCIDGVASTQPRGVALADVARDVRAQALRLGRHGLHVLDVEPPGAVVVIEVDVAVAEFDRQPLGEIGIARHARAPALVAIALEVKLGRGGGGIHDGDGS